MKANCRNGWRVEYPEKVLTTKFFDEDVRAAYVDDDWYFVLDDICKAVKIKQPTYVAAALQARWQKKVAISAQDIGVEADSIHVKSLTGAAAHKSHVYLCINEFGVLEAMTRSRKLEARQFREWTYEVLSTLRKKEGIATYNLAKLTEKETQDQILDHVNKAKHEGWDMYYDKVSDWWWVEKMTGGGDIMFVPVDDPYGRPFKWLEYDPTYEPSFDANDPDIKRPCPYYN